MNEEKLRKYLAIRGLELIEIDEDYYKVYNKWEQPMYILFEYDYIVDGKVHIDTWFRYKVMRGDAESLYDPNSKQKFYWWFQYRGSNNKYEKKEKLSDREKEEIIDLLPWKLNETGDMIVNKKGELLKNNRGSASSTLKGVSFHINYKKAVEYLRKRDYGGNDNKKMEKKS
jgi:hypothetical protein